jgi:hypothetical protein
MMKKFLSVVAVAAVLMFGCGYAFAAGTYLVYDPGGSEDHVQSAMTTLGYTFDVRSSGTPVTSADLTGGAYEALVIGWSVGGNYGGLAAVGSTGISGNAVITGHDADYHTWVSPVNNAARTLMKRMVDFAGAATGTGIVAFPGASAAFGYLPAAWGITAVVGGSNTVTGITADGAASGFYSGITTADLSNWDTSFHAYFTAWNPAMFKSFELGEYSGERVITIGTTVTPLVTPEPSILILLGCGLLGLLGLRKRD